MDAFKKLDKKLDGKQLLLLFSSGIIAFALSLVALYQSSNLSNNEILQDPSRSGVNCTLNDVTVCSTYTDRGLVGLVFMALVAMPLFVLTIAIVISNNRRFEKMLLISVFSVPYIAATLLSIQLATAH